MEFTKSIKTNNYLSSSANTHNIVNTTHINKSNNQIVAIKKIDDANITNTINSIFSSTVSTTTISQEEENKKLQILKNKIKELNTEEISFLLENEKYNQKSLNAALIKAMELNRSQEKHEIVNNLLFFNANPNTLHPIKKINILMLACSSGDITLINNILEYNININSTDSKNQNCLFYALNSVKGDNSDIISLLINKNININLENISKETPLLIAVREGLKNSVKVLIENGSDINTVDQEGNSLLHIAVENYDIDMVKMLVSKNANLKAINNEGFTPLNIALKKNISEIYLYLTNEFNKKQALEKKSFEDIYKDSINKVKKDNSNKSTLSLNNNILAKKHKKDIKNISKKDKDTAITINFNTKKTTILTNKVSEKREISLYSKKTILNNSTCYKFKEKIDSSLSNINSTKILLPKTSKFNQNTNESLKLKDKKLNNNKNLIMESKEDELISNININKDATIFNNNRNSEIHDRKNIYNCIDIINNLKETFINYKKSSIDYKHSTSLIYNYDNNYILSYNNISNVNNYNDTNFKNRMKSILKILRSNLAKHKTAIFNDLDIKYNKNNDIYLDRIKEKHANVFENDISVNTIMEEIDRYIREVIDYLIFHNIESLKQQKLTLKKEYENNLNKAIELHNKNIKDTHNDKIESLTQEINNYKKKLDDIIKSNKFNENLNKTRNNLLDYTCLHRGITNFYNDNKLELNSVKISTSFIFNKIKKIFEKYLNNFKPEIYGSYATDLCLPSSDLDIVVVSNDHSKYIYSNANSVLSKVYKNLENQEWISSIRYIDTAYIPIIKLVSTSQCKSIKVDITFCDTKHNGLKCVKLVDYYIKKYPSLPYLVVYFKQILYNNSLNDPYRGGLSSYAVILMVVYYYQFNKKNNPLVELDYGILFKNILSYYSIFDESLYYITPQCSNYLSDKSNLYLNLKKGEAYIVVVDPLNRKNNVTKGSYNYKNVKSLFQKLLIISNETCVCSNNNNFGPDKTIQNIKNIIIKKYYSMNLNSNYKINSNCKFLEEKEDNNTSNLINTYKTENLNIDFNNLINKNESLNTYDNKYIKNNISDNCLTKKLLNVKKW